jgi:nucleoside-diphosphate-sugar epimerase
MADHRNVLVVGGAGYVGGALTDLLATTGHFVRVYDALLYEEAYRKPIEFYVGDVRDLARLRPHLAWADAVVWLAALVGDGACELDPQAAVAVNQESVRALATEFHRRIVFTSTCSVYGAQPTELDETAPTRPLSVYAATKLAAERYLEDKDAVVFRLGTLFGVGDAFSRVRLDLVLNTLTARAHQRGRIEVVGGEQFRPLLHVRDVATAIVAAIEQPDVRGVLNLHRQNVRILDLAHQVRCHFPGVTLDIRPPAPGSDPRDYRVSSRRAQTALGFRPTGTIDQAIDELRALLDAGRLKDPDGPRYSNQRHLSELASSGERVA